MPHAGDLLEGLSLQRYDLMEALILFLILHFNCHGHKCKCAVAVDANWSYAFVAGPPHKDHHGTWSPEALRLKFLRGVSQASEDGVQVRTLLQTWSCFILHFSCPIFPGCICISCKQHLPDLECMPSWPDESLIVLSTYCLGVQGNKKEKGPRRSATFHGRACGDAGLVMPWITLDADISQRQRDAGVKRYKTAYVKVAETSDSQL